MPSTVLSGSPTKSAVSSFQFILPEPKLSVRFLMNNCCVYGGTVQTTSWIPQFHLFIYTITSYYTHSHLPHLHQRILLHSTHSSC